MSIRIQVVLAFCTHCERRELDITHGTSARTAVQLAVDAGLPLGDASLDPNHAPIGVFGEQVEDGYVLADGDRVEIYRLLQQDPKELRRHRAKQEAAAKKP